MSKVGKLAVLAVTFLLAEGGANGEHPSVAGATEELAVIRVPLSFSLLPLATRIDAEVPKQVAKLDDYEMEPGRKRYGARYVLDRERLRMSIDGSVLEVATRVYYGVEACRRTYNIVTDRFAMWPCVSCGLDEKRRAVDVLLHSKLQWDSDWRIRSKTTALPSRFPNRCDVTLLNIDVTDRVVAPRVAEQLGHIARRIDRDTPGATNFRATAERIWREIATPQEIAPSTWLVVEPRAAALSPIHGNGTTASTTLTLVTGTRIVVGARPPASQRPLPKLSAATAGSGFRIPLRVELPYAEASRLFLAHAATSHNGGYVISARNVAIRLGGDARLLILVDARITKGTSEIYDGPIELTGEVEYDRATQTVRLRAVDYALKSRRLLTRITDLFVHRKLRSDVEGAAVWKVAPLLANARSAAVRALNRPLGPDATLKTNVEELSVTRVETAHDRFVIHAVATGSAGVHVTAR